MKVKIKNTYSIITDIKSRAELNLIASLFSVRSENYYFTKRYRMLGWDGWVNFFKISSNNSVIAPTGLVLANLERLNPEAIDDSLVNIKTEFDFSDVADNLRDYQIDIINRALFESRCAIESSVASGKTIIGATIAYCFRDNRVLWLINRRTLVSQTERMIKDVFGEHGIGVYYGERKQIGEWITIATPQSIHRNIGNEVFMNHFNVLIMDECHQASQPTWYNISMKMNNCWHRFGLSGTVRLADEVKNYRLISASGKIIEGVSATELADLGFAVKPKIFFINLSDMYDLPLRRLEYSDLYRNHIVKNALRNEIIVNIAELLSSSKKRTLIIVKLIEHGRILRDILSQKIGHAFVDYIHGGTPNVIRDRCLMKLGSKQGFVLIGTSIMDMGVDVPSIDALIIAGAGKSEIQNMQRIGRALRPASGKEDAIVVDFIDGDKRSRNGYTLFSHSRKRYKLFKSKFGEVYIISVPNAVEEIFNYGKKTES